MGVGVILVLLSQFPKLSLVWQRDGDTVGICAGIRNRGGGGERAGTHTEGWKKVEACRRERIVEM